MGKSNILEQRPTFHNPFLSFKATKHGTKKENKTSLHHITSNESFYRWKQKTTVYWYTRLFQ